MNRWLVIFLALLVIGGFAKYVAVIKKENIAAEEKLKTERDRVEFLKKQVAADERAIDRTNMQEKLRIDNLKQLIIAKKHELQNVEARIINLQQSPDSAKAKQDAEADVKLQKDRVDVLQNQIINLEKTKKSRAFESQDDRHSIEDRFRAQDTSLNIQLKSAEDTLHALESELRQIKVVRNDITAQNEKQSKAQEIVNQKVFISDLKRQKRDLVSQHALQKNAVSSTLAADQGEIEKEINALKAQMKDEKNRYDALEKALRSFSNAEEGIRNQMKILKEQKANLEREIAELGI